MKKGFLDTTEWSLTRPKVAILVPVRDTVHSHFSFALTQLVKTSTQAGLDVDIFFDASTILINQREGLIKKAIASGADKVLWLDSDMYFPSTTLLRLLNHEEDIVGCTYMKRSFPTKGVAFKDLTDWESWVPIKHQSELEEVEAAGLGCMLMDTKVFSDLTMPYFEYHYQEKTKDWGGEDFQLFRKLRKKGHRVFIDLNLSMHVAHIGMFAFTEKLEENKKKR